MSVSLLAQGRPAPTPEEMASLVESKIHEEILFREALAMGLDKDDAIIKRRLAQKMDFVIEDLATMLEPTTAQPPPGSSKTSSALCCRRVPRSASSTSLPTGEVNEPARTPCKLWPSCARARQFTHRGIAC